MVVAAAMVFIASLVGCQVRQEAPQPLRFRMFPPNPANIPADSVAHFCPAEARFYLQFDDMARWRDERADDPLVKHLWSTIAGLRPPGMWDAAAKALNMDEAALTDRYFGNSLAIIGEKGDTQTAYVLVSRAARRHLDELPSIMPLLPMHRPPHQDTRPFQTFTSKDGRLLFAMYDDWLMVAPLEFQMYFESVLTFATERIRATASGLPGHSLPRMNGPVAPSIVEDERFQNLLVKLPKDRDFFFYTRDGLRKNHHVASVAMQGDTLHAHYAGAIDKLDDLYQQFDHGNDVNFGFMPASTITAASLNIVKKDAKGLGALNLFVFPKTMEKDVLPRLAAPIVVFLTRIEGDRITPNPGTAVPGVGVAIRMKDPGVTAELNRIVGGLHFLADVSRLDLLGGIIGSRTVRKDGLTYRIADFGDTLTRQIKDPETARMFKLPDAAGLTRLTYGRVGDWFLICTQESLYHECAAAHADESLRFTGGKDFARYSFEQKDRLIMSALTQAPELAALTAELNRFWQRMEAQARSAKQPGKPAAIEPPKQGGEADDGEEKADGTEGSRRIRRPMEWIAEAIKHRDSFHLQVWRDEDGDLRGQMSTVERALDKVLK